MGLFDDLKRIFTREARDAKEWVKEAVGDGNRALDQAERDLTATPEEKMDSILSDIESSDDTFAEIQAKADQALGRAQASEELAEGDGPGDLGAADEPADDETGA